MPVMKQGHRALAEAVFDQVNTLGGLKLAIRVREAATKLKQKPAGANDAEPTAVGIDGDHAPGVPGRPAAALTFQPMGCNGENVTAVVFSPGEPRLTATIPMENP